MQLNDTHMFDKGDLAYVALNAIEEFVHDKRLASSALVQTTASMRPFGRPWATSRSTLPEGITLQKPLLTNQ